MAKGDQPISPSVRSHRTTFSSQWKTTCRLGHRPYGFIVWLIADILGKIVKSESKKEEPRREEE
jgi:hypothetical protein